MAWWQDELTKHWGEGHSSDDTRRAAKTALDENERLLAMLKRIAEHTDLCSDVPHTTMGLRMLARRALEQSVGADEAG